MASAPSIAQSLDPATSATSVSRAELSEIDASTKAPALFFLISSVLWLLAGTVFALISSFKLHNPEFMGDWEWMTFGRARTAHLNTVIFGWSVNAAFAVAFWLMARLSRSVLRHPKLLFVAGAFWNIGVSIGVFGIMRGDSNSIEWLEMPAYATPLLFVAYALVGAWAIITFRFGKSQHIYVSQWYIMAALFWFPWLYSIAQMMLIFEPARGTVQALVNWWFAHNVLGLWFTPIGLGAVYYFLPKVLGKPIHSYYLSVLGFWSLAFFYNWAGVHHLIGGPVPAWVQTAGIAASFMMVVPVVVTAINHHMTMVGSFGALKYSPTLRFIVFGAVSYTLTSLQGSSMAIRSWAEVTHFTHYTVGHAHWGMYAFFTMVMFGSIYYILPRLLLKEWPSAALITAHFWATAIGILIYVAALSIGGVEQGLALNDVDNYPIFLDIVEMTKRYLVTRSLAGILITVGHIAFAVNFAWMLFKSRSTEASAPTLFRNPESMEIAR
ncbi:cbb3-type cytochrome c oxidase subunit I [Actomonas aquatica]|uniref:Cbb3-type cytochrome c oxidase subunit I n=1 Tax=Actomonas aquatica TaxID=2866162 RepID=A0ABZ1CC50_9BACT|nr:cbb3-type cytochrome c oxidase subunit I [Opitutus sp. WL0086]WRQ88970.1 cbb3-type cytochrome c oxidase subunit I [Opitutus sp. WL0086]